MFTGLIQAVGTIAGLEPRGDKLRIQVDPGAWDHRPAHGDSISVSGCCLTIVEDDGSRRDGRSARRSKAPSPRLMEFDAVPETLRLTTLGGLEVGSRVNLEHAATPTTLLGGHIVQGHVDGVGRVTLVQTGDDWRVSVELPTGPMHEGLGAMIVHKGSICVDGVSLTVAEVWSAPTSNARPGNRSAPMTRGFTVALIPTTLKLTTLASLRVGDSVNLEVDVLAKMIRASLERSGVLNTHPAPARSTTTRPSAKRPRTRA